MSAKLNLLGHKYGRLTVVRESEQKTTGVWWECLCDCGAIINVTTSRLRSGNTKSCGCLNNDSRLARSYKHGHARRDSKSRAWVAWVNMRARCYDDNRPDYHHYGGRGITVCDRWLDSFENFLADMGEPGDGLSLDRIDVNGNYSPDNCRWATLSEQRMNTRLTKTYDFCGEQMHIREAAVKYNISWNCLYQRIHTLGLSPTESVNYVPPFPIRHLVNGEMLSVSEASEKYKITKSTLKKRVQTMTLQEAINKPLKSDKRRNVDAVQKTTP